MNSAVLVGLLCASAVRAAVTPTAPGPGQSFNEGADCPIQWDLDTTGKWTSFSIDLMSGSNLAMTLVTNVASGLDGTKGDTSHTWKCPKVTPNSAIYFYQFSQAGAETAWTTRFQIASATGTSTPPSNSAQPDGKNIPWGTGHLASVPSPNPVSNSSTTKTPANTTAANNTNAVTTPTSGNSSAALATNSTKDVPASTVNSSATTPTTAAINSTSTTSTTTPKLTQTQSSSSNIKGSTTSTSGSSTSGPGASSSSGASALLPVPLALAPIVIAAMIFSA